MSNSEGGRIFFSNNGRKLSEEDQIPVLTVGVDVGSSTSHLVFSRIVMERMDSRYVVASRETLYESEILLTPYAEGDTIDAAALGQFIQTQYRRAEVSPGNIDTGALILTGVAAGRSNARRIGELFAAEAGKMVAVTAGDSLETVMAAHGSGAIARSLRERTTVANVDIGGGTSKIAICSGGKVIERTAADIGARLLVMDPNERIVRIEEAGRWFIAELGIPLEIGSKLDRSHAASIAALMTNCLIDALHGGSPRVGGASLLRLAPLPQGLDFAAVTVSGGVAEYLYGREQASFGDLGPGLAEAVRSGLESEGLRVELPGQGIRATVIGASQYTTQVSGTTIYVSPVSILPLRNVPVIAPSFAWEVDALQSEGVAQAIRCELERYDLFDGNGPVAIFVPWSGSATFARLDAFCTGVIKGLATVLSKGHPLVLVGDGDTGGLLGIHFHEEMRVPINVVSIDSLELREFDFIDVGEILEQSGAVPVVIKSLLFPGRTT